MTNDHQIITADLIDSNEWKIQSRRKLKRNEKRLREMTENEKEIRYF